MEDLVTARGETVHARTLGALRLGRAKPAALRHAREHRIQRAWTQVIAVVVQFFEHPLTVDAPFGGVVEDVDLPEGEKELAYDWIAHDRRIIALPHLHLASLQRPVKNKSAGKTRTNGENPAVRSA